MTPRPGPGMALRFKFKSNACLEPSSKCEATPIPPPPRWSTPSCTPSTRSSSSASSPPDGRSDLLLIRSGQPCTRAPELFFLAAGLFLVVFTGWGWSSAARRGRRHPRSRPGPHRRVRIGPIGANPRPTDAVNRTIRVTTAPASSGWSRSSATPPTPPQSPQGGWMTEPASTTARICTSPSSLTRATDHPADRPGSGVGPTSAGEAEGLPGGGGAGGR